MKEIPAHWEVKKLRYLGDALIGLTYDPADVVSEDQGTLVLRSSNIQNGRITLDDNVYVSTKIPAELISRDNDILICSRNGSRALVGKTAKIEGPAVGSSFGAFTTVFRSELNDFLYYVFNSQLFTFQAGRFMTTTINQITTGTLKDLEVPVPPVQEQRAIADFLARETGRIDELVRAKENLVLALDDRRVSTIAEQVFGERLGHYRDSGSRYFPNVPAHWDVVAFRRCVTISEGQVDPEDPTYKDVVLIAPNHIESGTGRILSTETADEQAAISGKYRVRAGDLIYSKIRPALNKVCLATFDCLCSADMYALSPKEGMSVEYLLYLMLSRPFVQLVADESMRVAMPKVNRPTLLSIRIPRPPLSEQEQIAARLRDELGRLATLSQKTKLSIEKLREYRSALISAAVTGQIDVRTHHPQEAAVLCQ